MLNLMNDFGKFLATVNKDEFTVKHGGTRKNAGSKPKYNEPTKTVSFRVPISKIEEIKLLITHKLSGWRLK
jgi:hypothetical protein